MQKNMELIDTPVLTNRYPNPQALTLLEVVCVMDVQVPASDFWGRQIKPCHGGAPDLPEHIVTSLVLVAHMYFHRDDTVDLLSECIDPVPGKGIFEPRVCLEHFDILYALYVDFEVDQGQVGGDGIRGHLYEDDRFVALCLTAVVD